jgi:hypothetical protein
MIEISRILAKRMTKLENITRSFCEGRLPLEAAKMLALRILGTGESTLKEKKAALAIAETCKKKILEDATATTEE